MPREGDFADDRNLHVGELHVDRRVVDIPALDDLVGDGLHLLGVGGIASGLVCLSSRIGVGPHIGGTIGAIHALAGATRLREGNGVGIVTGHRPPGPVTQAVVIVVLVVFVVRLALGSE